MNRAAIEDRIAAWCEQECGEEDDTFVDLLCEAETELRRLRQALTAVAWFFPPETDRGPAVDRWLDAADLYLPVCGDDEGAGHIRRLRDIGRDPRRGTSRDRSARSKREPKL